MAMPTRSARTTEFGEKAPTPVTIGPGSYLGTTRQDGKARPSLVPFSSSSSRDCQGVPSTPSGPGPGSYVGATSSAPNENDRPSYCFQSKAPRLAPQYTGSSPFGPSSVVQVPGPGTYEMMTTRSAPERCSTHREAQRVSSRRKNGVPPASAKRVNPPSVPRREQSYGYSVGSNGQLSALEAPYRMRTGSRIDSAGPGDYDPEDKYGWSGHGGAKFNKGLRKTVFEEEWVVKDTRPGPGEYNPKLCPRYHLEMPGSSAFMSAVPKGTDLRYRAGPGPGQYIPQTPLDANTSAGNVPRFSGSTQRGAWLRSEQCPFNEPETGNVPGPGAYGGLQDFSCFNKSVPKTLTDEKIGFSSTGRRESPGATSIAQDMPGPGQYDLDGQSIVGGLRHKIRVGCKGVFGSSGDRFRIRRCDETDLNTTPMHFWDQGKTPKRVVMLRHAPKPTSSFKSETSRFGAQTVPDRPTTPPATQYVLKDTFDQIVERGIKSKTKAFLSTTQRFHGGLFDVRGVGDDPGPGAYNVDVVKVAAPPPRSRTKQTSRLPQCARFSARTGPENSLGPGSHDIAGSLIKKTFNITFGGASIPAGAGRVAHRVYQARKQGNSSQMTVGAPATQESLAPANVLNSSSNVRETDILQSPIVG